MHVIGEYIRIIILGEYMRIIGEYMRVIGKYMRMIRQMIT